VLNLLIIGGNLLILKF
jgi:hypothetical protein